MACSGWISAHSLQPKHASFLQLDGVHHASQRSPPGVPVPSCSRFWQSSQPEHASLPQSAAVAHLWCVENKAALTSARSASRRHPQWQIQAQASAILGQSAVEPLLVGTGRPNGPRFQHRSCTSSGSSARRSHNLCTCRTGSGTPRSCTSPRTTCTCSRCRPWACTGCGRKGTLCTCTWSRSGPRCTTARTPRRRSRARPWACSRRTATCSRGTCCEATSVHMESQRGARRMRRWLRRGRCAHHWSQWSCTEHQSSQLANGESSSMLLVHGLHKLQPRHLQKEQSAQGGGRTARRMSCGVRPSCGVVCGTKRRERRTRALCVENRRGESEGATDRPNISVTGRCWAIAGPRRGARSANWHQLWHWTVLTSVSSCGAHAALSVKVCACAVSVHSVTSDMTDHDATNQSRSLKISTSAANEMSRPIVTWSGGGKQVRPPDRSWQLKRLV